MLEVSKTRVVTVGWVRRRCAVLLRAVLPVLLLGAAMPGADAAKSGAPGIPALAWSERSDWINVQTDGALKAKGDGLADDTAAIQAALDGVRNGTTLYFPPGVYRITRTLVLPDGPRYLGVSLIGHGRNTTLSWDGEKNGRMLWTRNGIPYSRFVGLTWDGRGIAGVGVDHAAQKYFETEIRHQHEAFRDFTEAGIRVGKDHVLATAETLYENCLFERCQRGVSILSLHDYDHTFRDCEFRRCGTGIYSNRMTNFYAQQCHFEGSLETDIYSHGEFGSSVRRCTSQGSNQFVLSASEVAAMVVQDCRIEGWKSPTGAVVVSGAPVVMFDCAFTRPPSKEPPLRIGGAEQQVLLSNNHAPGSTSLANRPATEVPAGKMGGVLSSAGQRFLKNTVRVPGRIFDAKQDFGAKGDGAADDTAAIQKAIDAARKHGRGALAYLPTGRYRVSRTLSLTGSDYSFGGSGFTTALIWNGPAASPTIAIHDPTRLTVENISVGHHDYAMAEFGHADNDIDILQTGSGRPSSITYDRVTVYGAYQKHPLRQGLHLKNLGKDDKVFFKEVHGNLRFIDSAQATVLLAVSYEGTLTVEGKSPARGGFTGAVVRLGTITDPALWLKDNHSMVFSDFYTEKATRFIRMDGDSTLPAGRLTIQGATFQLHEDAVENNEVEVNNYKGELIVSPYHFYPTTPVHRFVQQGEAPFDITIWGSTFYSSRPDFKLGATAKASVVMPYPVGDPLPAVPVTPVAEKLPQLMRALDDLRRLGMVDLQMSSGKHFKK